MRLGMIEFFNKIIEEYRPVEDIFCNDDAWMDRLKHIIFEDLTEIERRVLIIYSETASMSKSGKILHVSPSAVHKRITQIRKKIIEKLI